MKKLSSFYIAICMIILLAAGCKKGWVDVNYNPQDLTDNNATPDVLLPSVLDAATGPVEQWPLSLWMGYWSHWNMNVNYPLVSYLRIQDYGPNFQYLRARPRPEIYYLESKSRVLGQTFYEGVAKVMKALSWSEAVDMVNNMPYTDAYNSKILQPRYDNGQYIYEQLMLELDSAITLIKNAGDLQSPKIGLADIMFHGNKTSWVKFINTLKLRLLVHQANRPERQAYITGIIDGIVAEGSGFLESGMDASVNPGYSVANRHFSKYFSNFSSHNFVFGGGFFDAVGQFGSTQVAHANFYALELLKKDADPRIGLFYSSVDTELQPGDPEPFEQSDPQEYRGNKFGLALNEASFPFQNSVYVSAVGGSRNVLAKTAESKGIIKGLDMNDWIMTSIESKFLQAEAVQRGWIPGDAEAAYKEAVMESFRWLNAGADANDPGASDAIFENWYNDQVTAGNDEVSWTASPDKYKLLMYQKYIAFNGIAPLESWTDYRRNGRYPDVPVSLSPSRVGTGLPIRLLYNENEYVVNTPNVTAQGQIDNFSSKIWWMP